MNSGVGVGDDNSGGAVGVDNPGADIAEYVLSNFTKEERKLLPEVIDVACEGMQVWMSKGIKECMNIFNRRGNL